MSLGWLTQSALMPKKSKPISSQGKASLFSLQTIIAKQRQQIKNGKTKNNQKQSKKPHIIQEQKQQKIQQKSLQDNVQTQKLLQVSKKLQKKQKIYNQMKHKKQSISSVLVDFVYKTENQQKSEQFNEARQKFYAGQLDEIKKFRQQTDQKNLLQQARQRLVWQRQILSQLKGEQQKQKVKQSVDKKLDENQKKALNEVIQQLRKEDKLIELAKIRREQTKAQRLRKIKKLMNGQENVIHQ